MTAALESIDGDSEFIKLRQDVARTNPLVDQLLRVAHLDAVGLDVSSTVDLDEVAADVISTSAPWTVGQGRSIACDAFPCAPIARTGMLLLNAGRGT